MVREVCFLPFEAIKLSCFLGSHDVVHENHDMLSIAWKELGVVPYRVFSSMLRIAATSVDDISPDESAWDAKVARRS